MLELIVLGQIPGTSFQFNLRELFIAAALILVIAKLLLSRKELHKTATELNKLVIDNLSSSFGSIRKRV